jgi:hypothetical protein
MFVRVINTLQIDWQHPLAIAIVREQHFFRITSCHYLPVWVR